MRTPTTLLLAVAAVTLAFTGSTFAGSKTYQVTGPITALTDDTVTVQKGSEIWEVARSAATKVTGELKVGAKVTVEYTMSAVTAEVKGAAADKGTAAPKKDGKKKEKKAK
ncbi:MAG: hypothetical protein JWO89_3213 [Verrucomicrobiaceae bacterium]|nr:hypothetical protein [Verrucomicrobiaceae bacterium]MDB6118403.1 hypothetical protein [Verrucomicrobiaceae bacterium]